jgi:GNAT superfamily N-acetyltransferase
MAASKVVLESTGLRDMPEGLIRELYAATAPLRAEAAPDDPPQPLEQVLAFARSLSGEQDGAAIVARDDAGQIIGSADVTVQDRDGHRHVAWVSIRVLPGHRRAGIGRALLGGALEVAGRFGRSLLIGGTRETVPAGEAFARRIGAELGQVMIENRLDLRAVDRDLVRSWVEAGPSRAPGYHLEWIKGTTPDHLVPGVIAALMTMNTAPRDDLQVGDFTLTPQALGEQEHAIAAAGLERWACYAVEDATGDFVGLTDIVVDSAVPERLQVGNTGVAPEHRGRALGKWLKGAMTQQILDELPAARWLVTGNAASNDAMLSINRQLGFHSNATTKTWQISVERARAYLSAQP